LNFARQKTLWSYNDTYAAAATLCGSLFIINMDDTLKNLSFLA
jgi:hypothetical protein